MELKNEFYNILLVDDEADVLQAMKRKIDWEALGFRMAGTAENGQEALELAEQMHIDVVLTDIKMPFMDGLTLCKKLKENYRNIKVVIYSGFDDFEFAREAIHLEAEEYLLKPISAKDLENVFRKIKESLDKEFAERRNVDKLREYYQKSLPSMQEQLFVSILEGRVTVEKAAALLTAYEMNLEANCYSATILKADVKDSSMVQLINLSLKDLVEDYLKEQMRFYSCVYLDRIVVLFMMDSAAEMADVLYHLEQIIKMGSRMLDVNITASAGQTCDELLNIASSYQEAQNAMEYRAILGGSNQVIYINDIEPSPEDSVPFQEFDYQDILRAVKLGEREETERAIRKFVDNLRDKAVTPNQYQIACMELLTEFTKIGRAYKLSTREIFGSDTIPWQEVYQFSSLEELEQWLREVCTNLRRTLRHERSDSTTKLTEKAKEYIEAHYKESDLSAETLCRYLNVSTAYFSTIFKREVGRGFSAYLTKVRLEHAIELLMTTEDKTYVIAEAVGYTEPNYFSYVFKKEYGISPSKYRAMREKEQN
ncbi:MAG: response regulator [Lachnospiraceae bacterium]|nr:response regulator [Robinsoniella sp.]MDY3765238.1 response regulator [Lachnospiraceae bacterium]